MTPDLATTAARIETLIASLDASPDADARHQASELLRETMALYEAGLNRMIEIVRDRDGSILESFAADPAVATVLALHDLAPRTKAAEPLVQIARNPRREHSPRTTCERCGQPADADHRHLVDLDERRLLCSCEECWQAATQATADSAVRAVPTQSASYPSIEITDAHWDALQIPVGLAFFIVNSRTGRTSAFYPSPAGAVESLLPLDAWHALQHQNPWLSRVAADVEAVVLRKAFGAQEDFDSVVLPVDRCYDLIGRIRLNWKGFDGGDGVRREVDRLFAPRWTPTEALSAGAGS